jgi:putative acetyltransferase
MQIITAHTPSHWHDARQLVGQYAQWLQDAFALNIAFQGYDAEIANLSSKYALPLGAVLLAYQGDDCVGSIAFYPLREDVAELKRLYVSEQARGQGLGKQLLLHALDACRARGYRQAVLDTLARMESAVALYRALGFVATPAYNDSYKYADDVLYLSCELTQEKHHVDFSAMSYTA